MKKIFSIFIISFFLLIPTTTLAAGNPACTGNSAVSANFVQTTSDPNGCPDNTCIQDSGVTGANDRYGCFRITATTEPGSCRCQDGYGEEGNAIPPEITYCGYTVCGADANNYQCTPSGWAATGTECGGR